mmetsp:Transcript_24966/g.38852  ORF Transcript_24966/g.38852 Transcript_24966/m.38852 type:complete len:284 (+) Transcript_24966:43-894(+)
MDSSPLLFLLFLSLVASSLAKPSFLAPSSHFSQAIQKIEEDLPLYDINFHGNHPPVTPDFFHSHLVDPLSEEEANERIYSTTDHRGVRFHCLLPSKEQSAESKEELPVSSIDEEKDLRLQQEELHLKMTQTVERIGKSCVVRNEGWWSYEFCASGSVRQYHEDRQTGAIEADIPLGYAPTKRQWRLISDETAMDEVYVTEMYKGGQKCDLPPQLPRQTEIRWFCDPKRTKGAIFSLASIEEPSSCSYLVKIVSSLICDLPGVEIVTEDIEPTQLISCYPASVV